MANIFSFTEVIKIDSLVYKMYASHINKYLNLLSNIIILHQVALKFLPFISTPKFIRKKN